MTRLLDGYFFGEAARLMYDFTWSELCDWYIELAKPALRGEEGEARRKTVQAVMLAVFEDVLKLMHPIIPFVTEELWHAFPFGTDFIMRSGWPKWPKPRIAEIDEKVIADMNFVQETIRAVRNLRAEARIAPQQTIPGVTLAVHDAVKLALLKECEKQLKLLTKVEAVTFAVLDGAQIYLPVGELLDVEKEMQRLRNDLAKLEKDIEKSKAKLANEKFVERAPAEVIEKEKNTLADNEAKAARMKANLASLSPLRITGDERKK